jgi:hypothetical protein
LAPFVVNSAFAIELYLKTLGQRYNTELRGHDLLDLFDGLPVDAHAALEQHFSKAKWPCGITTLAEYRKVLEEMRTTFVEWRYMYENGRAREVRIPPMIFIMEVLHETCRAQESP